MIGQGREAQHHRCKAGYPGYSLQLPGHRGQDGHRPVEKPIHIGVVMSRRPSNINNLQAVGLDEWTDINAHRPNSVVELQNCQGPEHGLNVAGPHNPGMPRWNYRDAFDADYKDLVKRPGMSHEIIAKALDRSVHTVASYRRKGSTCVVPPEDVIRRFAALVGHNDPFRYMDNPLVGDALGLEKYANMPQWQKDAFQRQARAMDGSPLDPKQWEILIDSLETQARSLEAAMRMGSKKK